jgi:hypothetical protein
MSSEPNQQRIREQLRINEIDQINENRDQVFKDMMYQLETKGYYINEGMATGDTVILNGLKYNNEISKYTEEYEKQCRAFFNEENNNLDPTTAFHNIVGKIYDSKVAEFLRESERYERPKWLHTLTLPELQYLIDDHIALANDVFENTGRTLEK